MLKCGSSGTEPRSPEFPYVKGAVRPLRGHSLSSSEGFLRSHDVPAAPASQRKGKAGKSRSLLPLAYEGLEKTNSPTYPS